MEIASLLYNIVPNFMINYVLGLSGLMSKLWFSQRCHITVLFFPPPVNSCYAKYSLSSGEKQRRHWM